MHLNIRQSASSKHLPRPSPHLHFHINVKQTEILKQPKMTMPLTQQPPTATTTQQYYNAYPSHGSVGPVIAVLAVIIISGALAGMIGRLCSGKRIMGYGQYDVESWAERKFSSCIDGRLSPTLPLPRPPVNVSDTSVSTPTPVPAPTHQEREQEEEEEEEGEEQHSSSLNQRTHHV